MIRFCKTKPIVSYCVLRDAWCGKDFVKQSQSSRPRRVALSVVEGSKKQTQFSIGQNKRNLNDYMDIGQINPVVSQGKQSQLARTESETELSVDVWGKSGIMALSIRVSDSIMERTAL